MTTENRKQLYVGIIVGVVIVVFTALLGIMVNTSQGKMDEAKVLAAAAVLKADKVELKIATIDEKLSGITAGVCRIENSVDKLDNKFQKHIEQK